MNLYVSNIAFKMRDDELRQAFEPYGEIVSSKIIMDREPVVHVDLVLLNLQVVMLVNQLSMR